MLVFAIVLAGAIEGARAQAPDYVIGPQDVLRVTVWGQDALSGQFPVQADGAFNYPLLGRRIRAGGQTLRAVENDLKAQLADGYLTDPQVTVAVETYRTKRIFVVGEVRQPGPHPLVGEAGEMSLIEALARAGFTTTDAGPEVLIVRARPGSTVTGPVLPDQSAADAAPAIMRIDLAQLQQGVMAQNVALQDGDTVFVPRTESFYILGHVRNPGTYPFRRGTTVMQALALAGGLTEKGATNRIRIARTDKKHQRKEIRVGLDTVVQPGDTLIVPERYF